jgi:predicted transcriptional regulator
MRQLGHLEAEVMNRVWSWDRPVLVREVLEDLQQDRSIAYTTVMTVMDNLHRKSLLVREREGRAYRYSAAQSREEHTADLMEEVLASSGDRGATLMHFVEQIDHEELAALRAVISRRGRKKGPAG